MHVRGLSRYRLSLNGLSCSLSLNTIIIILLLHAQPTNRHPTSLLQSSSHRNNLLDIKWPTSSTDDPVTHKQQFAIPVYRNTHQSLLGRLMDATNAHTGEERRGPLRHHHQSGAREIHSLSPSTGAPERIRSDRPRIRSTPRTLRPT